MAMKNLYIFYICDHYSERIIIAANTQAEAESLFGSYAGFSQNWLSIDIIELSQLGKPQII
jgi:hypothetical protein